MACEPKITIPRKYLGITLQNRRKRGRPSTKGSEVGDEGEARCRARQELHSQYKPAKVCVTHELMCTSHDHVRLQGPFRPEAVETSEESAAEEAPPALSKSRRSSQVAASPHPDNDPSDFHLQAAAPEATSTGAACKVCSSRRAPVSRLSSPCTAFAHLHTDT